MGVRRLALTAALAAALASCAQRPAPAPAPAPAPQPVPAPAPLPPPAAPALPWQDAPLSPGDWTWDGRSASFGPAGRPSFVVRCEAGQVLLERRGAAPATGGSLTIRTSTTMRTLPARSGPDGLVAVLLASDPLLDAILYSRGRFAVEAPLASPLVVPTWPEPARVVED